MANYKCYEKKMENKELKKLKLKKYDLLKVYNIEFKGKNKKITLQLENDIYDKYIIGQIKEEKIIEKIQTKKDKNEITFDVMEEGSYAIYGKIQKKFLFLPLIILLILLSCFSISYASMPNFKNKIQETFIKTFKIETPTSPVITGGSQQWAKKRIIKIVENSKNYNGIDYYEYCLSNEKTFKNCNWKRTNTKNMIATKNGKYFVVFRAVKNGKVSKNSNIEEVWIDNEEPDIINISAIGSNTNVKIEIAAKDNYSGIEEYYYKLNNAEYQKVEKKFILKDLIPSEKYILAVKVADKVGNSKEVLLTIMIKGEDRETNAIVIDNMDQENNFENKNNNLSNNNDNKNNQNDNSNNNENNIENNDNTNNKDNNNQNSENDNKNDGTDHNNDNNNNNEEKDLTIPEINLNKVESIFTYGEKYDLPSYYKFGPSGGSVVCKVKDKEYIDTKTLPIGKHLIECEAKGNNGITTKVSKEVEVKVKEGEEEIWNGWIKLNLTYPDNSTNWQWRLGNENEIRTGLDNDKWQDYTGPILVKLSDIENVYIRYDLNGETIIVPPKDRLLVDIQPDKYTLKENEKTKIKIEYDNTAHTRQYRIKSGSWQDYNGEFEVEANTIIEARVIKNEKVFDINGNYVYTKRITSVDSVFISMYTNTPDSSEGNTGDISYKPTENDDEYITYPTDLKPSTYLEGPVISSNPSDKIVESTKVSVIPQEAAEKIYIGFGYSGNWKEYTEEIEITSNMLIKAYYIRKEDGKKSDVRYYYVDNIKENNKPYVKITANPYYYLSNNQESVEITITGKDYDKLEYSFDGIIYEEYKSPLTITQSSTIYARGTNKYGQTIEELIIPTKIPPKEKEKLFINIDTNPNEENVKGLINQTEVNISYDPKSTKQYYRLGSSNTWKEYTGSFKITENTTIYAYCVSEDGYGEELKSVEFLTTGISDPIIKVEPKSKTQQVKVEVNYDKTAKIKKYKIGNGLWLDYTGPFYVDQNTIITAYNKNSLDYEATSTYEIENIIPYPDYILIDKGKYFILKLNYPSTSLENSREYKYKENGEWKIYNPKGILLIKPEYKEEILNDIKDGIKVEDENGNDVIFTDHYYLVDVSFTEIMENIFMRWDRPSVKAPEIYLDTTEPTKEVEVSINYSKDVIKKEYNIVYKNGSETNWMNYTNSFKVTDKNAIVYARAYVKSDIISETVSKKITNIDKEAPKIDIKGDFETPRQKVNLTVEATDDLALDTIKWAEGNISKEYFKDNGNLINNNTSFTVDKNGIYTVYAKDMVGNETTKIIEITNIDKEAPNIFINVLTKKYGTEAEVTIDYGDSTVKEYKIGKNNKTYQKYTDNIIIKSEDVLDLANEDGSLSIYARGTDSSGNDQIVEEKIYILDLDMPTAPIIYSKAGYPVLMSYGIELNQDNYIIFDQTRDDIDNYYSLDKGKTWNLYTGVFEIQSGEIWAKSVKKESGLTIISKKNVGMPIDALGAEAYDKNRETYFDSPDKSILLVDESAIGREIHLYMQSQYSYRNNKFQFSFVDEKGKIISSVNAVSDGYSNGGYWEGDLIIPEKTKEIHFTKIDTTIGKVFEINLNIRKEITYPLLTEEGLTPGYNDIILDYSPESIERLYSLDEGKTWLNYENETIHLYAGKTIQVKGIDKNKKIIDSYSYTAILPDDALGLEAYDEDEETKVEYPKNKIIYVSKEMWNKNYKVLNKTRAGQTALYFVFLDENDEEILTKTYSSNNAEIQTNIDIIPEGTKKINITSGGVTNTYEAAVYELTPSSIPVIIDKNDNNNYYPILTEEGVSNPDIPISINYLSNSTKKLYSLDGGKTWLEYVNDFSVKANTTILAKAIDKDGKETNVVSLTATVNYAKEALGAGAYDKNENTRVTPVGKIYVDEKMQEKRVNLLVNYNCNGSCNSSYNVYFILKDKTEIKQPIYFGGIYDKTKETITIPKNTVYIEFRKNDDAYNLYEIEPNSEPIINEIKYYPTLTEEGIILGYSEITIDYFQTSEKKLYRINDGKWLNYEDKSIKLKSGDKIEAKGIDKNNKETEVISHEVTNLEDALEKEAYDKNVNTRVKPLGKIYVDEKMQEKRVNLLVNYNCNGSCNSSYNVYFILEDKTEVKQPIYFGGTYDKTKETITIPKNTVYIEFRKNDDAYNLYEIEPNSEPIINEIKYYPTLTLDKFTNLIQQIEINYMSYFKSNLYSINGKTWKEYDKPFNVEVNDIIMAKGINKEGKELETTNYTVTQVSDALEYSAFDNNYSTINNIPSNSSKIFNVTEDVIGRKLRIYLTSTPANDSKVIIYDKENNELKTVNISNKVVVFKIPENSSKVIINSGSSELNISEINLRPILEEIKTKNPIITINDVNWSTSKTIEITYLEKYQKQYSLDNGKTWEIYEEPLTINEPKTIIARSVDEKGKTITSSSFNVTKIDNVEPTIELDIPDEINIGTDYSLPTKYTVGNSNGTTICKIGEQIIDSTKDLEVGNYTIECSITNGTGIKSNIKKEIVVKNIELSTGSAVTTIDGSKWHVLEQTDDIVTLLSDYNLNSDGSYNTNCLGVKSNLDSYKCSPVAFDKNNSNVYNESDKNNIGYFLSNIYEPIIKEKLPNTSEVTLPTAKQIAIINGLDFNASLDFYSINDNWITTTNYWLKTASPTNGIVWFVDGYSSYLSNSYANSNDSIGIRPVITTSKSNLKVGI